MAGELAEGEEEGNQDGKCCAPIHVQMLRAVNVAPEPRGYQEGRAAPPAAGPSPTGGGAFLWRRGSSPLGFTSRSEGWCVPFLIIVFAPEGLYYLERKCACTQKSVHTSARSVIRALKPQRLEAEGAQREGLGGSVGT